MGILFERTGMDLVGPQDKSVAGYQHILVVLDHTTQYPEATPLHSLNVAIVAELMKLFAQVY